MEPLDSSNLRIKNSPRHHINRPTKKWDRPFHHMTSKDYSFIDDEVRQHLSKRYDFDDDITPNLPKESFSCPSWQIESQLKLKDFLNFVKSKLSDYDLERWHAHTFFTNLGGSVIPTLKKMNPEFLTQAWCKFYDILESFPVIPTTASSSGRLNSVHLCEAPGAFIASLNHNLCLNYPLIKWQWRATTLNPYYEGNQPGFVINDDRFMMTNPDNWIFGVDYTGDICRKKNLDHLIKTVKDIGPIHLVTADGSFDCADDPAEQENKVTYLHYCETINALSILDVGGSFVLKIFTAFECPTICLLYLLRCVFNKMSIYKPIVSKEGNSEMYVICLGFIGKESCGNVLNELSERMGDAVTGPAMFKKEDIDGRFLSELECCSSFFTNLQISVIERNIAYFQTMSPKDEYCINQIKKKIAKLFIENVCVRPLPDNKCLLGKLTYYKKGHHFKERYCRGSHSAEKKLKNADTSTKVEFYQTRLEEINFFWPKDNEIFWLESAEMVDNSTVEVVPRRGSPFKTIFSSRFCAANLLSIFNDVYKITLPVNSYDFWHSPPTPFYHISTPSCGESVTVDVRDKHWIENYNSAQAECLRSLRAALPNVEIGNNFLLMGLPLLTQFTVGLVLLLARNFEKVGFVCPRKVGYNLIFQNLRSKDFKELNGIMKGIDDDSNDILISIVGVQFMKAEYLEIATLVNHIILRKSSMIMACNF